MHQEMMRVTRTIVGATRYVVLSCGEFFIVDNQSWLLVYYYVVHNWVRIPIFISLDKAFEGSSSDNLTKVIMEAVIIGGGLLRNWIDPKNTLALG
jgi:hypothetical protein